MTRWTEHTIARAIALQTLARKCVVLVDNCNWTGHECDVLGVTTDLRIIDVEVKISRADLKKDVDKDKWWRRSFATYAGTDPVTGRSRYHQPEPVARLHPPKVWKHYYAMPASIWRPDLLDCLPSRASGVLLLREPRGWREPAVVVTCERRATPAKDATRLKPEQVMDIARLANLRMWEAYRRQESAESERSHYYQQVRALTGGGAGGMTTIDLQRLIREASTELGSDACREGKHRWAGEGGRACPKDYTSRCSQAVYRCAVCGQYDYGEPGGPGHNDCQNHCHHKP